MASDFRIAAEPAPGRNDATDLIAKAAQCRRLAAGVSDRQAAEVLRAMADDYEQGARLRA